MTERWWCHEIGGWCEACGQRWLEADPHLCIEAAERPDGSPAEPDPEDDNDP